MRKRLLIGLAGLILTLGASNLGPATVSAHKTQPTRHAPTTNIAQKTEQARPAEQCCARPACYRHLGPLTIESRIGGQHLVQRLYSNQVSPTYALAPGDGFSIRLPTLHEGQIAEGYSVRWMMGRNDRAVNKLLLGREVAHDALRQLPRDERGEQSMRADAYVALVKGNAVCSSYKVTIGARATGMNPVVSGTVATPRTPVMPPMPVVATTPVKEAYAISGYATSPWLEKIWTPKALLEAAPTAQMPARSGVMIHSAEGSIAYEDLPISSDPNGSRVVYLPHPSQHSDEIRASGTQPKYREVK